MVLINCIHSGECGGGIWPCYFTTCGFLYATFSFLQEYYALLELSMNVRKAKHCQGNTCNRVSECLFNFVMKVSLAYSIVQ